MRILLVEDDLLLVKQLKPELQAVGFAVEHADNGIDGEFLAQEEDFGAIVLDLGLPGKSGLEVLTNLRNQKMMIPILILTARDSWQERVDGLKAGADDYLGKPFYTPELIARLHSLIRRHYGQAQNRLQVAGLELNIHQQEVIDTQGKQHALTGKEFRLLRYMMLNAGKILSKNQLSEHIYEEDALKDSNVIEVYINRLRQRLGKAHIKTKRGQGYILVKNLQEET
ncbi:DNA-binding response regulator, OmpR family, contains REC and winged-helix (wHTH) domain [Allopseudospirillum japonicum]|uniref:DNA-binding response regulator, OmpR family, contains REC and winged-helix (WHTH) domain n=1 Tax=Allopseudospirillum japonicum TaxID=64971 RepID=A0A1H6RRB4_9GAMM|nr:response regulator transcription factor [Allopseudospirillum japonicum]SEI55057.1 DNA-binding response regulator, OmpR family, contains REC and winged-helix (wHTH) domain [Allopseudospirillum japonicum]